MPDHVHILIRKHRLSFEEMMEHRKDAPAAAPLETVRKVGYRFLERPVPTRALPSWRAPEPAAIRHALAG